MAGLSVELHDVIMHDSKKVSECKRTDNLPSHLGSPDKTYDHEPNLFFLPGTFQWYPT